MNKLALCISGGLGNTILQHLLSREIKPVYVLTDKNSSEIITSCTTHEIPYFAGNPRKENRNDILARFKCEVLLSVNYLFILPQELLQSATKYNLNIHGSLLPRYRGRTPHVWAIINGEQETGVTVHEMVPEVDAGRILCQVKIPIGAQTTGGEILKDFQKVYTQLVDQVIRCMTLNEWQFVEQDHTKATYFGKRTQDDGRICFDWQKERIRNWIRAQAQPYPGAFFYYKGERIAVHYSEFNDSGYLQEDPNGKILAITNEGIIVKTPNGALLLKELIKPEQIIFQPGELLS